MPPKREFKSRARKSGFRDAKLIVIACEGAKTESAYFDALKLVQHNPRVHVETLPSADNNSSPKHVYGRLRQFKRTYRLSADDELWVVVDRDAWKESTLSQVAQDCATAKFSLAVSTPSFELWLLLHVKDLAEYTAGELRDLRANRKQGDRTRLERELVALCGSYSKRSPDLTPYFPNVDSAIKRARVLDPDPSVRWCEDLGTRVYRVVESILPT